ncbi:ComEA family DNA-binding protein [Pseudarthrobacter sp. 1C304]|uniref:ComEA family DNA-binding protein n=1 Tax=Pseudarthrobacter sp. 1C304 TaxID=3457438 RepID=UPI003FD48089
MPRHISGDLHNAEPGHAGHRLAAAVHPGAQTGLLDGPPMVTPSAGHGNPGPDQRPLRGPRLRWRTGNRAAALVCLLAVAVLGWFWWQAAHATAEVSPLSSISPSEADDLQDPEPGAGPSAATSPDVSPTGTDGGAGTSATIIVHVAGAVLRAGIVELPRGSRLHEAIAAAGGGAPDADPDQLNLASVLEDGQKVMVPKVGEAVPAGPAAAGDAGARGSLPGAHGSAPAGGKVNLNTAAADELATLPRVGPVLAQRIVDWRTQHGNFQRVEELDAVDGFGPKLLEALLPLLQV